MFREVGKCSLFGSASNVSRVEGLEEIRLRRRSEQPRGFGRESWYRDRNKKDMPFGLGTSWNILRHW